MSAILKPRSYGVKVGECWVSIDFEAQAVSVTKDRKARSVARTEELGNGFLVDYNAAGDVIGVEVIAALSSPETDGNG